MYEGGHYLMKNNISMRYPASWWHSMWREALPSGNGRIGASVYGGIHEETVLLNHEGLWRSGRTPELPDVSDHLTKVRHLLLKGDVSKADHVLSDALSKKGYKPKIASPLPLGDLKVYMPLRQAFQHYRRKLNMETGEVSVCWTDGETQYERMLFVSRTDQAVVYEIRREGPKQVEASFLLQLHDKHRPDIVFPEQEETKCEEEYIYYAAQNNDGTDFGAVARVVSRNGQMEAGAEGLHVRDSDSVVVIVKLFVQGNRHTEWKRLKREISSLKPCYGSLLASHVTEHGRLFRAMELDLFASGCELSNEELLLQAYDGETPTVLVEKMWAYGRYLLISSSHEEGQPCHLYGLWCGDYNAVWAFHMVNENMQMIYWQAFSGNMPELALPMFNYLEKLMDDFRLNAARLYGCRGIFIPAPTAPDSGLLKHTSPHIVHWTGGAGWMSQHYYDYYLYTGDIEFLRKRALPFMRETALFYEDFLTVGEDGYYVSAPSISPENTPGNYRMDAHKSIQTTMNATMDFAIAKELLIHLIDGARVADKYVEDIPKWQEMLNRIPPYQTNEDGAIKEWMHPFFEDNDHHRHESHLYPIFPGTEVTRLSDPGLFRAFVKAVENRHVTGLKEQTGWSITHMANCYARVGKGDQALQCLETLPRFSLMNNLMTLHNDWRGMGIGVDMERVPVQIDANMGWTSAIQEMLLFSLPGELHIMPALPSRWKRGKAGPLLARGGVECLMEWDMDKGEMGLTIVSIDREKQIDILLPPTVTSVKGYPKSQQKLKSVRICEKPLHLQVFLK